MSNQIGVKNLFKFGLKAGKPFVEIDRTSPIKKAPNPENCDNHQHQSQHLISEQKSQIQARQPEHQKSNDSGNSRDHGHSSDLTQPKSHDDPVDFQASIFSSMKKDKENMDFYTSYNRSRENLHKTLEKQAEEAEIYQLRQNLIFKTIMPLPEYICVSEPFPIDCFPDEAKQLIKSVAHALQVQLEAVGTTLLGAIFIAARGNFKVTVKDRYFEALTEYLMVSLPSGGLKSAILDTFRAIFDDIEKDLQAKYNISINKKESELEVLKAIVKNIKAEYLCNIKTTDAQKIKTKANTMAKELEPIKKGIRDIINAKPRLLIDSPTMKELAMEMSRQGEAIGLFEAEGGIFKYRLRANHDNVLLKGYTMEAFDESTYTNGSIAMRHPCLAICALVQPGIAEDFYGDESFKDHGFVQRFLPVFPSKIQEWKVEQISLNPEIFELYEKKIKTLLKIKRPKGQAGGRTLHELKLEPESLSLFEKFAAEVKSRVHAGAFKGCEAFGNKLAGHAVRLAGAMHLLQHDEPHRSKINGFSMEAGIALARFYEAHVKFICDSDRVKCQYYGKKILKWMDKHKKTSFSERDACRGVGHCKVIDIRTGLSLLEKHHYLTQYHKSTGQVIVVVNPNYFEHRYLFHH